MPMVQFVEQFQPVRCIATRRAHPEPHFGVVFSQRPHLFRLTPRRPMRQQCV